MKVGEAERGSRGGGLGMMLVLRKCGTQGCKVARNASPSDKNRLWKLAAEDQQAAHGLPQRHEG